MPPPDGPRPSIIGADSGPEAPFPLKMKGEVVKGFGRGSKEVYSISPHLSIPQDLFRPAALSMLKYRDDY